MEDSLSEVVRHVEPVGYGGEGYTGDFVSEVLQIVASDFVTSWQFGGGIKKFGRFGGIGRGMHTVRGAQQTSRE